jgi:hypothetical protein
VSARRPAAAAERWRCRPDTGHPAHRRLQQQVEAALAGSAAGQSPPAQRAYFFFRSSSFGSTRSIDHLGTT